MNNHLSHSPKSTKTSGAAPQRQSQAEFDHNGKKHGWLSLTKNTNKITGQPRQSVVNLSGDQPAQGTMPQNSHSAAATR